MLYRVFNLLKGFKHSGYCKKNQSVKAVSKNKLQGKHSGCGFIGIFGLERQKPNHAY